MDDERLMEVVGRGKARSEQAQRSVMGEDVPIDTSSPAYTAWCERHELVEVPRGSHSGTHLLVRAGAQAKQAACRGLAERERRRVELIAEVTGLLQLFYRQVTLLERGSFCVAHDGKEWVLSPASAECAGKLRPLLKMSKEEKRDPSWKAQLSRVVDSKAVRWARLMEDARREFDTAWRDDFRPCLKALEAPGSIKQTRLREVEQQLRGAVPRLHKVYQEFLRAIAEDFRDADFLTQREYEAGLARDAERAGQQRGVRTAIAEAEQRADGNARRLWRNVTASAAFR